MKLLGSLRFHGAKLMIFGEYDEYRERMTGTNDIRQECESLHQTEHLFESLLGRNFSTGPSGGMEGA